MTKVTIEFDSMEDAQIAYNAVMHTKNAAATAAQAPVAPVAAQAPAAVPTAPVASAAPTPPTPPAAPVAPTAPAGEVTQAQVVQAAQAYARVNGPAAAKGVMAQFGVTAVKDVRPEQYAAVIAALAV